MTKIHVIRHKLQIDVEVDPGDGGTLARAADVLKGVKKHVEGLDRGVTLTTLDSRLARVTAPEPKPEREAEMTDFVDDGLDIPPEPSREPEPAAAE